MIQRIRTKPSISQRIERSTGACVALLFAVLFAALTFAEQLCRLLGVPFDARLG